MGKTNKRFSNERIKDGELNISVVEKEHQASLVLTLNVENYSKLKKRIFYYKTAQSPDFVWRIQLVRVSGTLFVILSTKGVPHRIVNCSIDSIDRTKVSERTAEDIGRFVYVSEFCNRAILDPKNKFLPYDVLTVKCNYDIYYAEACLLLFRNYHSSIKFNDQGGLNYIKHIYMTTFCADFTIILLDGRLRVHKVMLCVCSKALFNVFRNDEMKEYNRQEVQINTFYHIMHLIFLYVYCRELNEMDDECRTEMLLVARLMEIDSLIAVLEAK